MGTGIAVAGGAAFQASAVAGEHMQSTTGHGHIRSVTAITHVYGDGQKFVAVAVEYDLDVIDRRLTTSTFAVESRTITRVYANRATERADHGANGHFVIIELPPDDTDAALWATGGGGGAPSASPSAPASASAKHGAARPSARRRPP
ncbi:hypothetical protein [Streptomyces sp. NEAU-YJ-81]|uniref:hypothetical protein n=1 Tax=Streptomyces sp. NEAU-YJ-81 TaxID=2820288 RepID=UPI0027E060D2|nr:hypothetical protein [Streptomyces sp. NEAU-YJ-81]